MRCCTEGQDYHCVTLAVLFLPVPCNYKIILLILKKRHVNYCIPPHQYRAKACPAGAFMNTVKILRTVQMKSLCDVFCAPGTLILLNKHFSKIRTLLEVCILCISHVYRKNIQSKFGLVLFYSRCAFPVQSPRALWLSEVICRLTGC